MSGFCRGLVLALMLAVAACGTRSYQPGGPDTLAFLDRANESSQGDITLRAALPTASETEALTGLGLYEQGIQPLWIEVTNASEESLRVALWSVDREYFSPAEVAYMNRRGFSDEGYQALERWFLDSALPRRIPPGETRSGFIYTNLTPGTKGFNLDLFSASSAYNFTMFVDLPGFTPDHRLVQFSELYPETELVELTEADLGRFLAADLPCCATGPNSTGEGRPLNLVLVGSPRALRRSLLRGQWRETSVDEKQQLVEELHYFDGRIADGRFYLARRDSATQLVLHIWLSRWRLDGEPVWVAQTYFRDFDSPLVAALRRSGAAQQSDLLAQFVGEAISADLDSAQIFALQNFWYSQSVKKVGVAGGARVRDGDNPGTTFDGVGYVTRGTRGVLFVSDSPAAFGDARLILFENPSGGVERAVKSSQEAQ